MHKKGNTCIIFWWLMYATKGQTKSYCFLKPTTWYFDALCTLLKVRQSHIFFSKPTILPKNEQTDSFYLPNAYDRIVSFVFWTRSRISKSPFKINSPLLKLNLDDKIEFTDWLHKTNNCLHFFCHPYFHWYFYHNT